MIVRKSHAELEKMRRAGLLVHAVLQAMKAMVAEGVTTHDLEVVAERMILDAGAKPAFKGYYGAAAGNKFPFVLCTSVNSEVVHGMPSRKRVLVKGDIVSIDTGVQLDGYFGDSALTIPVGEVDEATQKLLRVTEEALELGIQQMQPGNRLFDVCGAVERHVTGERFSIVREYVGPRDRNGAARGAAGSQLRRAAERESAAEGRHGAGDRADGQRRQGRNAGFERSVDRGDEGWRYSAHFEQPWR